MSQLSNTSSLENARATKNGIDPIQDFPARRDRQFRANPVLMGDTRYCPVNLHLSMQIDQSC